MTTFSIWIVGNISEIKGSDRTLEEKSMDCIFKVADNTLFPWEIDAILDEAIVLCPAMKRNNAKMHPANARRAVPSVCSDGQNDFLVAEILNALCELL